MPPIEAIRSWLFDAALPLWGGVGVDPAGGFLEELELNGDPRLLPFKRTRVTARQIYVFSHAAELGWADGAKLSNHGYAFLLKARLDGGGWARRLTPTGEVLDAAIDLYDQAFALFALAWRYRLTRDREPLALAHALLDFLEQNLRAGPGRGFTHEHAPGGWRYQNPHMHLLEASLAMAEASGEARFLELGRELVTLFRRAFFDGRTLGEYFTPDFARAPGDAGRIVEPGHMFEWAWILARYQRLTGEKTIDEVSALTDFAETHGVDARTGATFNEVTPQGDVLNGASRAWPNTERVKGWLGRYELQGGAFPQPAIAAAQVLLDRYLAVTPRGSWIDSFDQAGRPLSVSAPASTLYHVALAFAEILRLAPKVAA